MKTLLILLSFTISGVAFGQYSPQVTSPPTIPSSAAMLRGDGNGNAVAATGGLDYGYPGIPIQTIAINYTTSYPTDANLALLHPTTDNNARTWTIDSDANAPFPVGTTITFINLKNTITILLTSDTLYMAGVGAAASGVTLDVYGMATAIKVTQTVWLINGTGLTVIP